MKKDLTLSNQLGQQSSRKYDIENFYYNNQTQKRKHWLCKAISRPHKFLFCFADLLFLFCNLQLYAVSGFTSCVLHFDLTIFIVH